MARLFVCPSTDTDEVRAKARFAIAAYLNVPVYADFQPLARTGGLTRWHVGGLAGR